MIGHLRTCRRASVVVVNKPFSLGALYRQLPAPAAASAGAAAAAGRRASFARRLRFPAGRPSSTPLIY